MLRGQGLQDAGWTVSTRCWEITVYRMLESQILQDSVPGTQGPEDTITDHPKTNVTLGEKRSSQQRFSGVVLF